MPASPTFDAFRLARMQETLAGVATMAELPRLGQSVIDRSARLRYEITGRVDGDGYPGAVMRLSARLPLRCERCNEAVPFELEREVPFRFVADEQALNALPIEDDETEEVIGSSSMALLPWLEDEAILSLPLVPRHADCVLPLEPERDAIEGDADRPKPFAVLARLRKGDGNGNGPANA